MRLQRPSGPSEVTCPKCRKLFGLTAEGKITAANNRDEFSQLPAPMVAAGAPSRPKNFSPKRTPPPAPAASATKPPVGAFHSPVRPTVRRPLFPSWTGKLLVVVICLMMPASILAGLYWFRDSIPLDSVIPVKSIVAATPFFDSHEKVLDEFDHLGRSASSVIATLKTPDTANDTTAVQQAVKQLDQLTRKSDELRRRAVALPAMTPEQWSSLMEWFKTRIPESTKPLQKSVDDTPMRTTQRIAQSAKFREAATNLMFSLTDTRSAIETAWSTISDPKNDIQEVEYQVIMAKRGLWQAVIGANSENDYQSLPKAYGKAADAVDLATHRLKEMKSREPLFRVFSPYFGQSLTYGSGIAFGVQKLEEIYGPLDQSAEVERYAESMSNLQSVGADKASVQPSNDPRMTTGVGRPPFGPPNHGPSNPIGPGPIGPHGRTIEQQVEFTISDIRSRHPVRETVLIRIEDRVDGPDGDALINQLKQDLDIKRSMGFGFGPTGLVVLFCSKSLSEVVAEIDWAEVLSTDQGQRLIHVKMKPGSR